MRSWLITALLVVLWVGGTSRAQLVGTAFTYQGQLTSGGSPANGTFDMRFRLFDSLTGGTQLGALLTFDGAAGDPAAVTVANGLVTVSLDFGNQFGGNAVYLQVAVRTHGSSGAYTVLSPRQLLTGTPYAMGLALPINSSINSPGVAFQISNAGGSGAALTSGFGDGLDATSTSAEGNGIVGVCNNGAIAYGVWGSSTSGFGVEGDGTSGATGGRFTSDTGVGLTGTSSPTDNYTGAILGMSTGTGGVGVKGIWDAPTTYYPIIHPGVWGDSSAGSGVAGLSTTTASNGAGVYGWVLNANVAAVWGEAAPTSGASYAVLGTSHSAFGWAGFFQGNLGATGTKSFVIDHPLDPENKYLLHYCAEGPVPQNVYNGVVTTDAGGEAWVTLPDYFGEINKDFRYTLTVIDDDDFALARVSRQIKDNRFAIKTSRGNVTVSWEVKGTRNDRYVRANGAPVEVAKPEAVRGTYLQPEVFGMQGSKGQFRSPVAGAGN